MKNKDFDRLKNDEIKVGDFVAMQEDVTYGWGSYLCSNFRIMQIARITPKRTKAYSENGTEINLKYTHLYKITSEMMLLVQKNKLKKKLANCLYNQINATNYMTSQKEKLMRYIRDYINALTDEKLNSELAKFEAVEEVVKSFIAEADPKEE